MRKSFRLRYLLDFAWLACVASLADGKNVANVKTDTMSEPFYRTIGTETKKQKNRRKKNKGGADAGSRRGNGKRTRRGDSSNAQHSSADAADRTTSSFRFFTAQPGQQRRRAQLQP
jgi:hypothetical protein